MDQIDRKILALFQHDTRRIAESLGSAVGLSAAAVQRRLKRLRAGNVILAEIARLDAAALAIPILCIVTIAMVAKPAPRAQLERFKREMSAQAEVQQCYQVTGAMDFVVVVATRSMQAYAAFARRWFEDNPSVARFDTHVVLDGVKVGMSLPI